MTGGVAPLFARTRTINGYGLTSWRRCAMRSTRSRACVRRRPRASGASSKMWRRTSPDLLRRVPECAGEDAAPPIGVSGVAELFGAALDNVAVGRRGAADSSSECLERHAMSEDRATTDHEADARTQSLAPGLWMFTLVCLLGNLVGSLFRYPDLGSAVLFPPYAVLTAALLVSPRRRWLSYILVAMLMHFVTSWPRWSVSWVLLTDVANIARALTAAVLLGRVFKGPPRLDSVRSLGMFVACVALIAPAVGATIGAANVVLHGGPGTYRQLWSAWFLSNALTGLTMLPAFVLLATSGLRRPWHRADRRRVGEAMALAGALVATTAIAFLVPPSGPWHFALQRLYAPLPVLIWAALRFGSAGASLTLTAATFISLLGADRGFGPFLESSPAQNVLVLQGFLLLTALPVLCIAAVSTARHGVVQLHRALLASLPDHVAIIDARGTILEVNDAWRRFAETSGVLRFERAGVGDDYAGACRLGAETGDPIAARALTGVLRVLNRDQHRFEMEYDHERNGQRTWSVFSVETLERPDGGAVVTRADETKRRHALMEIEEQRRALSHLARVTLLGQLSGALAHELNQPLASIAGNAGAARILLERDQPDLEELDAILRDIITSNQRAADVIQRLRALLDRNEVCSQLLAPVELVNEVLELAHAELIARRVVATALFAPDIAPVFGDRVQLQQVLLNLVLNACEAMSSTPPVDRRLSVIVNSDARGNVHLSVHDCGTGIPAAVIDRLFEPFVTTKPEGLGLGLSISRTIVAAHGGRMWAQNNADRGATVHCLLSSAPVAPPRAVALGGPTNLSRVSTDVL